MFSSFPPTSAFVLRVQRGYGSLLGLLQARRESYAAHRTILLIEAPSGSSDVSSYNALDWKHVEAFDHHAPALQLEVILEGKRSWRA